MDAFANSATHPLFQTDYSEHPNTRLVRISNGLFVSGSEIIQVSNNLPIQKPDKNEWFSNGQLS
jgi:hypothetical protein